MSTEVAVQKFSFPFSCAARLSQPEAAPQQGCVQLKASGLRELRGNRIVVEASPVAIIETLVQNEKRAQGGLKPPPGGVTGAAARLLVGGGAPRSAAPPGPSGSEKLSVEGEDQRPAAKRQLSSESAARTVTAVKKSALKEKCVYDVKTIVQSITHGARSELERLRAIWSWLCQNIGGDRRRPGRLLRLLQPLLRDVQGQSLQNVKSDHLWNAVLLGGHWFLLDACWGAGRVDVQRESFVKRFDDFYFLTDPEEFVESHFPDEERWQLLEAPVPLEEFERRVFKTSAFFTLGLRLIQPHHFHIVTGSSSTLITRHRDFLQCDGGAAEPKEEPRGASSGLLTVTHRAMTLRLLPPASGVYDVKLFARPEAATAPLMWVCSFTVECPTPRTMEEIPENPFLSWGLGPAAAALGVAGGSHGSEAAEAEDGVFLLELRTSRPLMALCELVHPALRAAVAKRCLATQIQPDAVSCHVLCPARGFYRLSVFVRDYEKTDAKFQNAGNFLLRCDGKVVAPGELYPPDLGSACGPGTRTLEAGLSKFSHATALVSTQQGKCNVTFHNQRDLELHAVLGREAGDPPGAPLARQLFSTYTDSKVTVSVSLPDAGVYRLGLYAKVAPGGDFSPMCDFVLRNSCERPGAPFPGVYSAWGKGCVLFEPRAGRLDALAWVRFRVRVPGARRVSVMGETGTELKLNKSRVWEGEVFSGVGLRPLKLAAALGEAGDMAVLLTFDIKPPEGDV
ncbi:Kyphoscoliosis peptidase [Liparis tanakae]|uniref:Kyphoscoliosis peptidase n=1 Tax=Liparis tanakae TaxID=230148 RepID=A0A4Z2GER5_9TELE|nr:Kyphoscoliosis peptidase [Liparis tanakae]